MKIKNHFRIFLLFLGIFFLPLEAFSQQQSSSMPEAKKVRGKWHLKFNGKLYPFTPSAEGVDVTIGGVTYFVEETNPPFEISTFAEPDTSNDHNTNPPHLNALGKPAATISNPIHTNPQQSSNPSALQTPSQPSSYTTVTVPTDNKNLSSTCQAELQDIYTVKLGNYIEDLTIKEKKNSNLPFDQNLPNDKTKEITAKYELIRDFLTYSFHLKNNTLDQFKSRFEDDQAGHSYTPPKPSLAKIIKEQGGINVTSKEVIYKDQNFQTYYPNTTLKVELNHIPDGNFFSTFCNLDIQTGTGDRTYSFSEGCNDFDLSQGGQIRYKILEGKTLLDNGAVVTDPH